MFPTWTIRPPSTSGSTFEDSSTFRPVCSWMRFPMSSTTPSSSSTALVTVTGSSWFSSAHSASNSRRMRNSAGMRWRSASSSRKFTKRSSASVTIFLHAVALLLGREVRREQEHLERRGPRRAPRRTRPARRGRGRARRAPSRPRTASGRRPRRSPPCPSCRSLPARRRELGEVDLRQRLLDQAAVVLLVERLARDLLGGGDRQVRDLLAELVERAAGLVLDVAARLREQLLALLRGLAPSSRP